MKRVISLTICISLTLTLCSCGRGLKRFEKTFIDAFDTVSTVVAYDTDSNTFERHCEMLHDELIEYNNLYDIYDSHKGVVSLKDINEKAADSPVKADKKTIDLLLFGKEVYGKTNGAVNICLGSVLEIWHEYREEGKRLPDMTLLKDAAKHTDINDLVIDGAAQTVSFADSKLKLDVGAIAKGYAAQKLKEYASANLWESAMLNLGGNVTAWGLKPDGSKWNIQIENPDPDSATEVDTLTLTDTSVVTSGDYQRYYEVDGVKYCHIIDEKTLMPANRFSSVTVICEDSALADALSTALFILPLDEGKKIINGIENADAVWIDKDYKVIENT